MNQKMHLVVVDMGYGHQRAAYPLLAWSFEGNINLNNYDGSTEKERAYWLNSSRAYEKISYFKKIPFLGKFVFDIMDYFQRIQKFYPKRPLTQMTLQQRMFFKAVKNGVGKNLIEKLNNNPLPFVTSFFVAAYSAEYYNYKGPIYCIICDADISRAWAPINPSQSRIVYFASTERVKNRLMMYGVRKEKIIITGFPLPIENIGENREILKKDFAERLSYLDSKRKFRNTYASILEQHNILISENNNRLLTLTFAVGGAGAQRELGILILKKLKTEILKGQIKLNLVAGIRDDVNRYFINNIELLGLKDNKNVTIIYHPQKIEYFRLFNECLRNTDILWTKPSELSFYTGLAIPIIMSEPVGSQEHFNRDWLLELGAGLDSLDPEYVHEWLFDWLDNGRLARTALNAYLLSPKNGTKNIIKEVFKNNNL